MTKKELQVSFDNAIKNIPKTNTVEGIIVLLMDDKGTAFSVEGSWHDNGLLTCLLKIRDEMDNRGNVDILINGDEINFP